MLTSKTISVIFITVCVFSSAFAQPKEKTASKPDQKLQELINLAQSGDYKPPLQKLDLFCNGQKVSADSKLSPEDRSKLCKLTMAEFQAIRDFTVEGNFSMNAVLRKTAPSTPEVNAKISNLKSALQNLDP